MNYMLNSLLVSEDEQKMLREMAQAKKQGFKYIKVVSEGDITRIHSVDFIRLDEKPSAVFGKPDYTPRYSTGVLEFVENKATGELEAEVLDTEFNRFFLARHIPHGIRAVDEKIYQQIEVLQDKEYKMEMTREEEVSRQIRELEKEKKRLGNVRREMEKRDEVIKPREIKDKPILRTIKQMLIPEDTTEGV